MNVVCPECGSIFRVDPAKIPLAGVRARCSVCGGVIAIGERGRIDDDFAVPQPAATQSAQRPASGAASPAPLPPRPAITMPTPPQPSRAQVDALLSGMSRKAMPNAETPPASLPSVPATAHGSGPVTAVPASPASATPAMSAPSAPGAPAAPPRTGFPFSHLSSAPAQPGGAPVPRPAAPRAPTPVRPMPRAESAPAGQVPNAAGAGAPRPPAAPRPLGAPAPSVGHAAPAAPEAPPAGIPFAPRPAAPPTPGPAPAPRVTAPVQRPAAPGSRAPINPFLSNDPNVKAKRLARALVSDIVAYFPDKHREGLRNGTLRELFREEIKKSYEEYVDQMTREFAESTTHFQDALNDVLAGGKRIF